MLEDSKDDISFRFGITIQRLCITVSSLAPAHIDLFKSRWASP